ncbi:MAG TPA: hypothetical protein PK867_11185 [Pirellulales bacterium]|nr:hypothetical protein [Pirellulales bacterium]
MRPRPRPNVDTNWPTPDEIAERTASIRSQWSPHQLRVRAGLSPEENAVEITVVSPGALDGRRGSIDFG